MEAAGPDRSKCKISCMFPKALSSGFYFSAYSVSESMIDAGLDMLMESLLGKLPNQNVASKTSLSNKSKSSNVEVFWCRQSKYRCRFPFSMLSRDHLSIGIEQAETAIHCKINQANSAQ